jgi:transposase
MPKGTLPLVTSLTCAKCGHRMTPAVIIPGMSLFTGRTFACDRCGNVDIVPA